ncbi:MAG: UDP-2,3-diacylglucosamine hydrolase [uncultured bacterium]|nr:MAG: UDP-2,3-diacylglucosamine hydrolase [uncultured bacterium]
MADIFISDLHLEEARPGIAKLFLQFLAEHASTENSLYILGDFFESWIGDDDHTSFNQLIINALKNAASQGLTLYFMHGNRDFLIGKKFLKQTKCQLLPDKYVVNLAGTLTLLLHGDTLCTEDLSYLKFRKKSRNWLLQKIFLLQSLKKRKLVAERYRRASKQYTSTATDKIMDVTQKEVERLMLKYEVQHMIHGHTHRPFVHQFKLNGIDATRTVLAPWHERGSALICHSNGHQEWVVVE